MLMINLYRPFTSYIWLYYIYICISVYIIYKASYVGLHRACRGLGYDHNYVLRGHFEEGLQLVARVSEPTSGRWMLVKTDQPGDARRSLKAVSRRFWWVFMGFHEFFHGFLGVLLGFFPVFLCFWCFSHGFESEPRSQGPSRPVSGPVLHRELLEWLRRPLAPMPEAKYRSICIHHKYVVE